MDFDADRIYYSHQNLHQQQDGDGRQPEQQQAANRLEDEEERAVDSDALRRHFREFLRKLHWHMTPHVSLLTRMCSESRAS